MNKKDCVAESFWDNGKIQLIEILREDNSFTLKNFNNEGKIWREVNYDSNNEKHGIHKLYYSNGKLKIEECYEHGTILYQKTYNKNGNPLTLDLYEEGNLKKRIIQMIGMVEL